MMVNEKVLRGTIGNFRVRQLYCIFLNPNLKTINTDRRSFCLSQ